MRIVGTYLSTVTCVIMLLLQASGIHLHAEGGGHAEHHGSHGVHVEQMFSSEHLADAHLEHVEVAVPDTVSGVKSIDPLVFFDLFRPLSAPAATSTHWFAHEIVVPPNRLSKLRPQLRAPPGFV